MIEPYYSDGLVELYQGDCRDLLYRWPSTHLLVTDPPYGIDYDGGTKHASPDVERTAGDASPFDPTHLLRFPRAVIFGGNNFASRLPDSGAWIVWDKVTQNDLKVRIAEAELAWTSCLTRTRVYRHLWSGNFRASEQGQRHHANQKPERLMRWILNLVARPGDVVLDPYAGSGATLLAAKSLGLRAIGCELLEQHCATAARRLSVEGLALDLLEEDTPA